MNSQDVKKANIPNLPGIYLFKKGVDILYIGKATSLKDRVKSYFSNDLIGTRGPLILDMVFKADKIDFIKTDSVLEALMLESELIKKHQPKYNTKEKDNKSFNYVVITKEDFPRVLIVRGRGLEEARKKAQTQVLGSPPLLRNKCRPDHSSDQFSEPLLSTFGPFPNSAQLREALKIIRKIFPFRDKCLPNQGKACFNYQIGLCPGICIGKISQVEYRKIVKNIKLFFEGKKKVILRNLEREMSVLAKRHEFEKAGEVKKTIFALNHIQDVAIIASEANTFSPPQLRRGDYSDNRGGCFRIEAYDIAHLSGTNTVGVMTVIENGEINKAEYRKFKINKSTQNDIAGLQEMLERRLAHKEWLYPQIIVVDGGKAQIKIAREILQKKDLNIAVVSVAKDNHHKAKAILGDKTLALKYSDDILLANSEAHRFAINYHKNLRNKELFS
ncbi:MAG: GIY-YIG nuclease family protein [bacterium]